MESQNDADGSINEELGIRASAIIAMGKAGDRDAVQYLKQVLENPVEADLLRGCAAIALGRISTEEVIPILIDALEMESTMISRAAVLALRDTGNPQAIAPLQRVMQDQGKPELHALTINALSQLGGIDISSTLIQALKNPDVRVRRSAALALGGMRLKQALPPLIELMQDSDECLRAIAASALGLIGDNNAAEVLIKALHDNAEPVRAIAASSLGYLEDGRAIAPLEEALDDRSKLVRKQAMTALSKLKNHKN